MLKDLHNFTLDPTVHTINDQAQMLIGNRNIIKRDMLNMKIKEAHQNSLEKTGAPIDKARQTYVFDENTLEYNPKTMAVGTHAQ